MASVWEGRFAEFVRRLAALRESTNLELLPDLMPVLSVVDPSAPELLLARRERLCGGTVTQGAVAAQYGTIYLCNRTANQLFVLEDWFAYNATNPWVARWEPLTVPNAAVTAGSCCYLDTRGLGGGNQIPQGQPESTTAVALTTLRAGRRILAGGTTKLEEMRGIVLGPGSTLMFQCETANTAVTVTARWRERVLDTAELQGTGA